MLSRIHAAHCAGWSNFKTFHITWLDAHIKELKAYFMYHLGLWILLICMNGSGAWIRTIVNPNCDPISVCNSAVRMYVWRRQRIENNTVTLRTKCGGREAEREVEGEIAPLISSHFLPASTQQSFYGNPSKSGVRWIVDLRCAVWLRCVEEMAGSFVSLPL